MRAIFDQAAMEGAAAEVKESMGVDRAQLDLAWSKEFDAAICLVKDVSHDYEGITFADDVCPTDIGKQRFLRRFKVSQKADLPDAYRLIRYFIAKAYAEVDAMVITTRSESHQPLRPAAPKP